jgi:hypothetical protein
MLFDFFLLYDASNREVLFDQENQVQNDCSFTIHLFKVDCYLCNSQILSWSETIAGKAKSYRKYTMLEVFQPESG